MWQVEEEGIDDPEDRSHTFEGTEKQLRFAVVEPAYPSDPGVYFITFDITRQESQQVLRYYRSAYRAEQLTFDDVPLVDDESVELLRGDYDLSFSYARDDAEIREPEWQSSWSEERKLPHLVRLTIAKPGGGDHAWPETIVRLAVDSGVRLP